MSISKRRVEKMREREAKVGLEPDDVAARWLAENAPEAPPAESKASKKSKLLHQYRNRRPS